jgi:hypothetical protein
MSDEFAKWGELSRLWHASNRSVSVAEIEATARRQARLMLTLAIAEAGALGLGFIASLWIAMQTALVSMSALNVVFFGLCGFLQHRMRKEPVPSGGADLLTSLGADVEREEWNLAQLGVGRAVTLLTLAAIAMLGFDHLRFYATTPAPRLWALFAIATIVIAILAGNLALTRQARNRKARVETYMGHLGE